MQVARFLVISLVALSSAWAQAERLSLRPPAVPESHPRSESLRIELSGPGAAGLRFRHFETQVDVQQSRVVITAVAEPAPGAPRTPFAGEVELSSATLLQFYRLQLVVKPVEGKAFEHTVNLISELHPADGIYSGRLLGDRQGPALRVLTGPSTVSNFRVSRELRQHMGHYVVFRGRWHAPSRSLELVELLEPKHEAFTARTDAEDPRLLHLEDGRSLRGVGRLTRALGTNRNVEVRALVYAQAAKAEVYRLQGRMARDGDASRWIRRIKTPLEAGAPIWINDRYWFGRYLHVVADDSDTADALGYVRSDAVEIGTPAQAHPPSEGLVGTLEK